MRGIEPMPWPITRRLSLRLWCLLIVVWASGGPCWSEELPSEEPLQPAVHLSSPKVPQTKGAFLGYEDAIRIGLDRHPLLRRSKETALAAEAVTDIYS